MLKKLSLLLIAHITIFLTAEAGSGQEPQAERSVAGVWLVKVTPKNCETGETFPAAAFESLQTYEKDGTMLMSIRGNTNLATVIRTPFHGLWRRENGWSHYRFKVVHVRSNSTTGLFIGNQITGGAVVLSESGDEFTINGYTQGYDVDGNPLGGQGCSDSVGLRFKLD